ncbi:VIT and VWA domain-containing protein [Actinophytocola gossypii]|uniref:VWA domain-containing protein n=1 Tax=Actinophytocola gossypii TaxID=2812003 RepID=A0ABT2JG12_9PSEU|nr:VIT and VWA domain-containing protein [Actinophytocola gossypii]MCT2586676.1 VWA domain-containing protein [Actinophytocola gossypii]
MNTRVDLMDLAEVPARPAEDDGVGCLRTDEGNLPLDTIDVRAAITGLASSIELTQGFHNPHDRPLEATYIFPLPPRAAVTALRMEADGHTVDGLLKEREQARADYDEAVTEGKRASIAEEERPGVFTMRVGNIMPGERVAVHLTLAGSLSYEDDAATFRFPLVVAPRFIPGEPIGGGQVGDGVAPDTDAVPDASRISPPILLPGFPNPVRLSVAVDVDPAGLPLAGVATSLHATATTDDSPTGLRVRLDPGERADRDFLLRLRFADSSAIRTSLVVRPDDPDDESAGGTFAVTVLPPARSTAARHRDVVLVLDRSGSMGGWKMVAARRAAARIVDTLGTDDRFAALAFDNTVTTPPSLPEALVDANDHNRFRAVEFLSGVDARGGTQMLEPLTRAGAMLADSAADRDRVLVLVTDGQVGNEDQLLRDLSPALTNVRVHTVGIDRAVNEAFLQRLAGSKGRYELVESEDRLDEVMTQIHRRITAPVVTDLRLAPDGLVIDTESVAPAPLPDLFEGAPAVITGRYTGAPAGSITVSGSDWRATVAAGRSDNPGLAALWARARLRDLEDRYVVGGDDHAALEKRIVDTSLRFGVLSRFTAFVAVDQRVVNEGGEVHRVTQPVDLPSGWEPPGAVFGGTQPMAARAMPFAASRMAVESAGGTFRASAPGTGFGKVNQPKRRRTPQAPPPPASPSVREFALPSIEEPQFPITSPPEPKPPALAVFAEAELRKLMDADDKDVWTRLTILGELAERIKPLLDHWRRTGERETACHSMTVLAKDISEPTDNPNMADSLWYMALATLYTVSRPKPPPRSTFWKKT